MLFGFHVVALKSYRKKLKKSRNATKKETFFDCVCVNGWGGLGDDVIGFLNLIYKKK